LVFSLFVSGFAFSEETEETEETEGFPRNTITLFTSFFGAGLQYEFQLFEHFSLGGRFENKKLGDDTSSLTIQGLGRFYPFSKTSFIDGMLGYSNFDYFDYGRTHHFSYCFRLGNKIDFGKPGGLTFEWTIGFFKLNGENNIPRLDIKPEWWNFIAGMAAVGESLTRLIFTGGPVLTIGLGYRF